MLLRIHQALRRSTISGSHFISSIHQRFLSVPAKVFVGGLSYDTNEESLKNAFSRFGELRGVAVVVDKFTGRSKGYGFVHFANVSDAENALREMDGRFLDGRTIRVDIASCRPPPIHDYAKAVGPPPRPPGGPSTSLFGHVESELPSLEEWQSRSKTRGYK